ncbi:MAG: hypothetical protein ACR2P4_04940 [Gammaproteobacteria bacterium]
MAKNKNKAKKSGKRFYAVQSGMFILMDELFLFFCRIGAKTANGAVIMPSNF